MIGLLYIIHACVNKVTVKPATKHKLNDMAVLQEHYLQKNLHVLTTFLLSLLFLHVRFCNNMTLFHLLFFYFSQNYLFARYSALVRNKERQRDKQPTANSSASAGTIIVACLSYALHNQFLHMIFWESKNGSLWCHRAEGSCKPSYTSWSTMHFGYNRNFGKDSGRWVIVYIRSGAWLMFISLNGLLTYEEPENDAVIYSSITTRI